MVDEPIEHKTNSTVAMQIKLVLDRPEKVAAFHLCVVQNTIRVLILCERTSTHHIMERKKRICLGESRIYINRSSFSNNIFTLS